jgi:hypothetical protein
MAAHCRKSKRQEFALWLNKHHVSVIAKTLKQCLAAFTKPVNQSQFKRTLACPERAAE